MLENKSVKEIISLIKKKDVSVKEIVGLYFERIKKFNPSLNAIVSIKVDVDIIKVALSNDKNFVEYMRLFGFPLDNFPPHLFASFQLQGVF